MLKNLRRASVLKFPQRRTLNSKPNLNPENFESKTRKHCVYAVFSCIFCNLSHYIQQHDILNVNVWASRGVCG